MASSNPGLSPDIAHDAPQKPTRYMYRLDTFTVSIGGQYNRILSCTKLSYAFNLGNLIIEDLRRPPLKMMFTFSRTIGSFLSLFIKHMVAKKVQLCLIELSWQISVRLILDEFQARAQSRNDVIKLNRLCNYSPQMWQTFFQLICHDRFEKHVHAILFFVFCEDWFEHFLEVVGLNDTTSAPDLKHGGIVDIPFVLAVSLFDHIDALDIASQAS